MKGVLLYVSPAGASAALMRWRRVAHIGSFSADDFGWSEFNQLLSRYRHTPVMVLADAVEEDFRVEWLPHALGRARADMLERRLRQVFRGAPFCVSVRQGRAREGRRDDAFLFSAILSQDLLRPWLDVIALHSNPLVGVYSLSFVDESFGKRADAAAPHALVVSLRAAGLRLSYLQGGHLKFSRLAPPEPGSGGLPHDVAAEVTRTRRYLVNQRLLPREARLSVLILPPLSDTAGDARSTLNLDLAVVCTQIELGELGESLGGHELARHPELLHLSALAAMRVPPPNLAPLQSIQPWLRIRNRAGTMRLTVAAGLAAAVFTGLNVIEGHQAQNEASELSTRTRIADLRYAEIARQFPRAPAPPRTLEAAVESAGRLAISRTRPFPALDLLAAVLADRPDITLTRLRWAVGDMRDESLPGVPGDRGVQTLFVEAQLARRDSDLRQALDSIEDLAARLRRVRQVKSAAVTRLPVNLDPSATVSGNTREGLATEEMVFGLRVVLEIRT